MAEWEMGKMLHDFIEVSKGRLPAALTMSFFIVYFLFPIMDKILGKNND